MGKTVGHDEAPFSDNSRICLLSPSFSPSAVATSLQPQVHVSAAHESGPSAPRRGPPSTPQKTLKEERRQHGYSRTLMPVIWRGGRSRGYTYCLQVATYNALDQAPKYAEIATVVEQK